MIKCNLHFMAVNALVLFIFLTNVLIHFPTSKLVVIISEKCLNQNTSLWVNSSLTQMRQQKNIEGLHVQVWLRMHSVRMISALDNYGGNLCNISTLARTLYQTATSCWREWRYDKKIHHAKYKQIMTYWNERKSFKPSAVLSIKAWLKVPSLKEYIKY